MSVEAFGLSPAVAGTIRRILAAFTEVEKAVVYVSRAMGTHKPGAGRECQPLTDRGAIAVCGRSEKTSTVDFVPPHKPPGAWEA